MFPITSELPVPHFSLIFGIPVLLLFFSYLSTNFGKSEKWNVLKTLHLCMVVGVRQVEKNARSFETVRRCFHGFSFKNRWKIEPKNEKNGIRDKNQWKIMPHGRLRRLLAWLEFPRGRCTFWRNFWENLQKFGKAKIFKAKTSKVTPIWQSALNWSEKHIWLWRKISHSKRIPHYFGILWRAKWS